MDYTVKDSSIYRQNSSYHTDITKDCSVRIGMVREIVELQNKTIQYTVEVIAGNRTIPVSCVMLTRFGGVFNYEEYSLRAWGTKYKSSPLPPAANSNFKVKSGDAVLIAYIDGSSRQGVILGGLTHPARTEYLDKDKIEYKSVFNGLTQHVRDDGSYKIEFNGKAINSPLLEAPPTGTDMPSPQYNPLKKGSFLGFANDGSFIFSDGTNYTKLVKNKTSPVMSTKVGSAIFEINGAVGQDAIGIKSSKYNVSANNINMSGKIEANIKAIKTSIKGQQVAIGNDQFELFKSLYEILDTLGKVFLISPTGNTTPIASNPDWASKIIPLMLKLKAATGSLKDPESFSPTDPGDVTLEDS